MFLWLRVLYSFIAACVLYSQVTAYTAEPPSPPVAFSSAEDYMKVNNVAVQEAIEEHLLQWTKDPIIIKAVKEQNQRNLSLTQDQIEEMDRRWILETAKVRHPFIDSILHSPFSEHLRTLMKENPEMYTEIFLTDNRGLVIGTTNITTDYWQGDEEKWQKVFLVGPRALYVSAPYYDDSAKAFQVQVSLPVSENEMVIGVLSAGLNIEELR